MAEETRLSNLIDIKLSIYSEKPFLMGKSKNIHKYNAGFTQNIARKDETPVFVTQYFSLIIKDTNDLYKKGDQVFVTGGTLGLSQWEKKDGTKVTEINIWSDSAGVAFLKHVEPKSKTQSAVEDEEEEDTF